MGCIASAEKFSVLVILRREFLDITGNFCAAKLIEYFRHWTKWKVKNHRTPWVYQPLKKIYADLMGEHSLHVIRAAIALLEEMKIITKQKNPGNKQDRTWQYKLNFDVLNQLLEHGTGKTDRGTFNAEQYHRSNPEASKPQQHAAVELKNLDEPEIREQAPVTHFADEPKLLNSLDELDSHEGHSSAVAGDVQKSNDANVSESAPVTHFVDEPELDYSSNKSDCHEGHSSAAGGNVQKANNANVSESAPVSHYVDEVELDLADSDDVSAPGAVDSGKPSKGEIAEVCNELRRLRINPQVCLGVVKKHWGNVFGAIARVKEALFLLLF